MLSRIFIIGLCWIGTSAAHAGELTLFCSKAASLEACSEQVAAALTGLGCKDLSATTCNFSVDEAGNPKLPYCDLSSSNCSRPRAELFGKEICYADQAKIAKIPRKLGVHNGYYFGIFGSYSRSVCLE